MFFTLSGVIGNAPPYNEDIQLPCYIKIFMLLATSILYSDSILRLTICNETKLRQLCDPASGEAVFQQLDRQLQSQSVPLKGEVSEVAVCLRIIQVDQSIEEDTIVCFIIHFTRQILKWW